MSRIGATLSGIERTLLNRLADATAAATISSLRIATGSKINAPRDDPSGFIRLSGLQSRLREVTATMTNVSAADSMVSQTQTTLDQIRTQLNLVRTELVKDEGRTLSQADRDAGQAKIDAAIAQINSLAGTEIGGRRLLDGSANFNVSGRNSSQVADLWVHSIRGPALTVSGSVMQAATQAELTYSGSGGQTTDAAVFTLTGDLGSASVSVASGESLSSVATKINDDSHKTGVTASVAGDELTLTTVRYGSNADVAVVVNSGAFDVTLGGNYDGTANGSDATVQINGITYGGNTAAEAAELRHREATGVFAASAGIRVTGDLGFHDFTINQNDSLQDVANAIAAESATTGVTAAVEGNDLVIQSTVESADSQVTINVTSGSFDTLTGNTTPGSVATLIRNEPTGLITAHTDVRITGNVGSADVHIHVGDTLQEAADDINAETAATGVRATVSGNDLLIQSVGIGSGSFAQVETLGSPFDVTGGDVTGTAYGTDAVATDSGADAGTYVNAVDGNRFSLNANGVHYEMQFAEGFTGGFDRITVSGSALKFALGTDLTRPATLSIPGLQAGRLGGTSGSLDELLSGGALSGLGGNTAQAIRAVDEALGDVTRIEGAVDGFYNASITSATNLLSDLQTDLENAIDEVDLVDTTEETSKLALYTDLASNAVAGLSILQSQRSSIVIMLQKIAGLI